MSTEIQDIAPRLPTRYLRDFFTEKDLPTQNWVIESELGDEHHISNVIVVEHITNCPISEAKAIGDIIRKIDFKNGDINHFLKHLTGAIING